MAYNFSLEDRALQHIRSQIQWKIIRKNSGERGFGIRSCREKKEHVIFFPRRSCSPFYKLDLLHEFIHALHCETLPPAFSSNIHKWFLPFGLSYEIKNYFNAAGDWFVAGRMAELCREKMLEQIDCEYNSVKNGFKESMTDKQYLIAGLVSAQAAKWLQYKPISGGKVEKIVAALLSAAPEEAALENFYVLLKGICGAFNKFTVEMVEENGLKLWHYRRLYV
ncbi:MAG: hypothetical protein HZA01_11535 [Nitrospinae bacterium]|nr:hypothetical protein [Nitrospinota bacterium]